ncbi:MAG: hypothetical protein EOM17_17175, partial [Synergistales bacterium]|nr:hypothetical protein [Synergistales bacterium]
QAAINRLVKIGLEESEIDATLPIGFASTNNPAGLEQLEVAFSDFKDQMVLEIGSVIGTHVGTGGIILSFFTK